MTPIVASRVQAMAGIFHPFVSLCFHCIFVPGHIASRLNSLQDSIRFLSKILSAKLVKKNPKG